MFNESLIDNGLGITEKIMNNQYFLNTKNTISNKILNFKKLLN